MDVREQNEHIRAKNREAVSKAYENMNAAFHDREETMGINAVLRFLHEKGRLDTTKPLSEQLRELARSHQIRTRYISLDPDWYTRCAIPMLVKTTDKQWLAVIPVPGGRCVYVDDTGKQKVTAETARQFTDNAIGFYKVFPNEAVTMGGLVSFLMKCVSKGDAMAVLAASVLTTLSGMLLPWINSFLFAHIIPDGEGNGILAVAALMLSAVTTAAVLQLVQSLVLANSMLRCSVYTQSAVFSRLLALRPEFFKTVRSGELSDMITQFSDIINLISGKSIRSCIGILLSLVYLIQISHYAPQLLVWVLLFTLLQAALMVSEGILNFRWSKGYAGALSRMSGFCYELFSGMEQVKLNGAEVRMLHRWSEYYLDVSRKENKPAMLQYACVWYKLLQVLATGVIFLFGVRLSASDYIAFSSAYGAYLAASAGASVMVQTIASFRAAYSILRPFLQGECEEFEAGKKKPAAFSGEITVSDVRFRYSPDGPYVIDHLSMQVRPGESIGIIGPSGCGKSTLVRLLLGLEKAESGSIYLDGLDMRELDLQYYRSKIGTVLQNTSLISGDIYSNITIMKPNASMEEVQQAVDLAGLRETIASLPMGLHTPVSEENYTLSGGERQRILIARAVLTKPSILIFDEATSALDNITQADITRELNKLSCTKLIVAHRLSTIEPCDRIFVMDQGGTIQSGSYEELKRTNALFQRLIKRQLCC